MLDLQLDVQITGVVWSCTRLTVLLDFNYRAFASGRRNVHINSLRAHDVSGASALRADGSRRGSCSAARRTESSALKRNPVPASVVRILKRDFHLGFSILSASAS